MTPEQVVQVGTDYTQVFQTFSIFAGFVSGLLLSLLFARGFKQW